MTQKINVKKAQEPLFDLEPFLKKKEPKPKKQRIGRIVVDDDLRRMLHGDDIEKN